MSLSKSYSPASKVKVFSHNDLDGVGCGIVAKLAFPDADVTYCGYHNIDEKVAEFIKEELYKEYDYIFITDISLKHSVVQMINDRPELAKKLKLLDHHATAMHLNEYDWAFVQPMGRVGTNSGTNMLFEYLKRVGCFRYELYLDGLTCFVEKIRRYDSWEWYNVYDDENASALNDLFWLYGWKTFEKRYVNRFRKLKICRVSMGDWLEMFDDGDRIVLDVDNAKKKDYINRKQKQMITGCLLGYRAGFVFAEQYISELGNILSENNPELDFIVILDLGNKKVSYRTTHDYIDLGKDVASHFGGGGHAKASGSQLNAQAIKLILTTMFGHETLIKHVSNVVNGKGFLGKLRKVVDKFTKKG